MHFKPAFEGLLIIHGPKKSRLISFILLGIGRGKEIEPQVVMEKKNLNVGKV